MTQSNDNDALIADFIKFATEHAMRTEEMLKLHEERMTQLQSIQADIQQILASLAQRSDKPKAAVPGSTLQLPPLSPLRGNRNGQP